MVTGKRYIKKLVEQGIVDGWDDPRLCLLYTSTDSLTILDIAYGIGLGILQGDQCDLHIDQSTLRDLLAI